MSVHTSTTKKRKSVAPGVEKAAKRPKIDAASKNGKKETKAKAKDTEFRVIRSEVTLSVSPVFANDIAKGCNELLDSMVMRYIPALQGVVLAHSKLSFLNQKAPILADCPFIICRVAFDATVWSPRIGMRLEGKISVCSPDHISLLIHRTFNVSIPRRHIPENTWEFEHGPAENDPDFGPDAASEEKPSEEVGGKWIHSLTAKPIGDAANNLSFTVIGLTVANEMLSVTGSLQDDPFHPRYSDNKPLPEDDAHDVPEEEPQLPSSDSDSELEDPFDRQERLGKKAAAKRKAEEETAAPKKKKSKRKQS
ncbi:hypothetical protein CYLTODRAFT_385060 [Cylindrobasidium torrendii FP15055 ss-10]|uniref:RPA43 OB domain-containing protein n=1 Tax=Cylindrobasidium torrendii FP15055 ss-10 TaxID=1314674 RepID=A0A0D7BVL8_9AGAR|nr:hypothetical protein CYLTODRAFT_385060 [Cylindrobasidium torrendii FP15055 ss-10]